MMEKLFPLFKIAELIAKEKAEGLSVSEKETLETWIAESESNQSLYKKLQNGKILVNKLTELQKFDPEKAFLKVEQNITSTGNPAQPLRKMSGYWRYAAAAALLIGLSYAVIRIHNRPPKAQTAQTNFLPGKQKAILITGNQRILLGNSDKKQIIKDHLADIVDTGSTLSYTKNDSVEKTMSHISNNTLITPRGGEYTVILSDGTSVMLNADSKLIYPIVFEGKVREVTLEGEAFFKVTKSAKVPFVVKTNKLNITVYGTEFNVAAYRDENTIQATLVEGSIGVHINNKVSSEIKIKPGQQFAYSKSTGNTKTKEVNTEQFIAWTKGKFMFENEPIENILKAMSRWYNFEFVFDEEAIKKQRFTLTLNRYDQVSKILDLMAASSAIKFSTEGNKIRISTK
ncbi:MAG TPA: FecR family protein [Bacteroidales bacterium]